MRPITNYSSYRLFLKDVFDEEKKSSKRVTLAQYAKRFDLSGPALNLILSGARNLTVQNIHRVARVLHLSESDREYFEALVLRDQATDRETRSYYSKKLARKEKSSKVRTLRMSDKKLLASWLTPALLIYLIDFCGTKKLKSLDELDTESIGQKFSIGPAEVRKLITLFQQQGLLSIDQEDQIHIVFEKLTFDLPQKEYVRAVASEMIRRVESDFNREDALFRALVFSVDRNTLPSLRTDLLNVFNEYMARSSKAPEENELVQAVVGVFPI